MQAVCLPTPQVETTVLASASASELIGGPTGSSQRKPLALPARGGGACWRPDRRWLSRMSTRKKLLDRLAGRDRGTGREGRHHDVPRV